VPKLRRAVYALLGAAVLAVSVPAGLLLTSSTAQASPTATADLQKKINQEAHNLDLANERYNQLKVTLAKTKAKAATLAAQVAPLDAEVKAASKTVDAVAVAAYKGSTVSQFTALLTAGSPGNLMDRLNTLNGLAATQQQGLNTLTTARTALATQQTKLNVLVAQQTNQVSGLAADKTKIQTQLTALQTQQAQLPTGTTTGVQGSTTASTPPPAVSGSAAKVVAYAYAQLGKPYVFGAAGPDSFDCSGLTMMAWEQVGVHLDHASFTQMNDQTTPVSRADLIPGDLVFFYGGEHVGIYVGNNSVIHAPEPGDVVKISTIDWMGGYTASGRPG
jgi:cell wall-associated NlpC family hydrolase